MRGLVMACTVLGLVLVIVWGIAEGERDRIRRARDRQLRHEVRHVKGEE